MSAGVAIAMAISTATLLGALAFATLARRADVRGVGVLSPETVHRDRGARRVTDLRRDVPDDSGSGPAAAVERAGELAREGAVDEGPPEVLASPFVSPDPEYLAVSRRQFFNRAAVSLMSLSVGTFTVASMVAFLWPPPGAAFGGRFNVGRLSDVFSEIDEAEGFLYVSAARTWMVRYPAESLSAARDVYDEALLPGMSAGLVAIYQKCPHLGCRVPGCHSSQWFECPCHGSRYNRVGEYKAGPAPRGMDRFPIEIAPNGDVVVDTGIEIPGPSHGTNTTGQEAEGPFCVEGTH